MKKALVLCGGGSKGAYELGAWKALNELGFHFDIVTGTSIGSLNGVMYVQHAYNDCEKLWETTRNETIMANPVKINEFNIKSSLLNMKELVPFVRSYFQKGGVDVTPFKHLLNTYIDPQKVKDSDIDFGVVCVEFPSFSPRLIRIKDVPDDEVIPYILASSSCAPLFPVCKIKEKMYIDGGYYDNLPIDFALDLGATDIVCVDLSVNITHKEYLNKPFIKYIHPSWNLGGFFAFEKEIINNNRILGYNDTMKEFGVYDGFRYTFHPNSYNESFAESFIILITNISKEFRRGKYKSLVRDVSEQTLFDILEKHTYRPLSTYEYYLRGIEVCAEFLNINHLTVYTVNHLKALIFDAVTSLPNPQNDILKEYSKIKKNPTKQREFLQNRVSMQDMLVTLNKMLIMQEKISNELFMNLLCVYPKLIIIMLLLELWQEKDVVSEYSKRTLDLFTKRNLEEISKPAEIMNFNLLKDDDK